MNSSAATTESRGREAEHGGGEAAENKGAFWSADVWPVLVGHLLDSRGHVLLLEHDGRIAEANDAFGRNVTPRWVDRATLFQDTLEASSRDRFEDALGDGTLGERSVNLVHAASEGSCAVHYRFHACTRGWVAVGCERLALPEGEVQEAVESGSRPAGPPELEKTLDTQKALHAREGCPFSVISIDIDRFRQVNSLYGHLAGDEVLRRVGSIVVDNVREEDFVARTGGEEFMVILPGLDAPAAMEVGERLRNSVEKAKMPGGVSKITISLGVASTSETEEGAPESRAETALRLAKERGRNCICCVD